MANGWLFSRNKEPMEFIGDSSHLPEANEVLGFRLRDSFYFDREFGNWYRYESRDREWVWIGENNIPRKCIAELFLLKE